MGKSDLVWRPLWAEDVFCENATISFVEALNPDTAGRHGYAVRLFDFINNTVDCTRETKLMLDPMADPIGLVSALVTAASRAQPESALSYNIATTMEQLLHLGLDPNRMGMRGQHFAESFDNTNFWTFHTSRNLITNHYRQKGHVSLHNVQPSAPLALSLDANFSQSSTQQICLIYQNYDLDHAIMHELSLSAKRDALKL